MPLGHTLTKTSFFITWFKVRTLWSMKLKARGYKMGLVAFAPDRIHTLKNWYYWSIAALWSDHRVGHLRAITSGSGNFCKIEKGGTFTHFGPKKHPHQWVQNCAFMHNCYSNRAYMHGYCSTCINILVFFSLSLSLFLSGALSSLSLSPHSS